MTQSCDLLALRSVKAPLLLAGLTGNLQLLQRRQERGTLQPEGLARQIASLREAGERLTRLTDDLLDVSRLRTRQLPLRPQAIELAAPVRAVVEQAQFGTTRHRLTLQNSCPEGRCALHGDPDRLGQVITNLLEHAVKYSPEGGEVQITLAPYNGGVRLCVKDQGIGLPAESLGKIFEPFGRAPMPATGTSPAWAWASTSVAGSSRDTAARWTQQAPAMGGGRRLCCGCRVASRR